MKWCYRFLFPVFVLLSVEAKSQAYTYHPFPSSNYTWEGFTNCGAMGNFWTDHWTFQNNGDVGIYHRIGSSIFIRKDSVKRVYLYSAVDTPSHELLLYDFSLNAGDTMHSNITYVVDYVDTLYYNTVWRRTLHTHSLYGLANDVWIEGIGSQQGPTGAWMYLRPSTGTGGPCSFSALCQAKQGGSLMYQRNLYGCPGYNSIEETSSAINLNLSPTPAPPLSPSNSPHHQVPKLIFNCMTHSAGR